MDQSVKADLLRRFQDFLDDPQGEPETIEVEGEEQDLYAIFIELAGLRTEVRTESRLVKTALDQFREVFDTLREAHGSLDRQLLATRDEARTRERAALRSLLLDMLDVRDGLMAALKSPEPPTRLGWRERLSGDRTSPGEAWREGLRITLRRFDKLLLDRRVTPMESVGRTLDPRLARVVATVEAPGRAAGEVVEDIRAGYLWGEEVLRPAEVAVSKPPPPAGTPS